MANSTRPGRDFEELIARIERLLSPIGAQIKSPDRLVDKITGQLREVDASVRVPEGKSFKIITIECRDHKKGKQDDRWIEQIVTKRDKLGVAKTIAVSSSGFSESAKRTAQHYGIELREMSRITDNEIIASWTCFKLSVIGHQFSLRDVEVLDLNAEPIAFESMAPQVIEGFREDPTTIPFFRIHGCAEAISAAQFFLAQDEQMTIGRCIGETFPFPIMLELVAKSSEGLQVLSASGWQSVSRVRLFYEVFQEEVPSDIHQIGQYKQGDQILKQTIKSSAVLGDNGIETEVFGTFSDGEWPVSPPKSRKQKG